MRELVALALPGGPDFVDELRRAWDRGDAVLPVDCRLPPPARRALFEALAPARVVEAGGTEEARASEAMEATFSGEPLTIGFNPQYLIDGLQNLNAPLAVLSFVDAFKPAVISPASEDGEIQSGYRYLIMPIRVTR